MEKQFQGSIAWRDATGKREATFGLGSTVVAEGVTVDMVWPSQILLTGRRSWDTRFTVTVTSAPTIELIRLQVRLSQTIAPDDRIFLNGYQSWTESRLFAPTEHIPPLRAPLERLVNTTGDYTFYPGSREGGHLHAWSLTSLVHAGHGAIFWADAQPQEGYALFEWDCPAQTLTISRDVAGRSLTGQATLLAIDTWDEVGSEVTLPSLADCKPRPVRTPVSGWTSWYNYYTDIDEEIILANLRAIGYRQLPIDFFQIDDGWQPAVGDWTTANEKFPKGMAYLADQVHRYGYKAGLWLAPLIVEQKSSIYQSHRDWLLTYDGERLVEAGFNPGWGGLGHGTYYVLNLDLPQVRDHLREVFRTVLQVWGYDLVKLDFLFAAALVPAGGRSRGQRMWEALQLLRECCGDKLILGCGVPLAPAWGVVDYCRIGPDIGLSWELGIAKAIQLRERISTHNGILNAIHRRHLSGRAFGVDPDVFILRRNKNDLSPVQRATLFWVNHIFGDLVFTSDDIGGYDDATMQQYRTAFPLRKRKIQRVREVGTVHLVEFEANGNSYLALINLSRLDVQAPLPSSLLYRSGEGFVVGNKSTYLQPFETRIYLMVAHSKPCVAGSDLHMFPGCEMETLAAPADGIEVSLHPHCTGTGALVIAVEAEADEISVNGILHKIHPHTHGRYVILEVRDGKFT